MQLGIGKLWVPPPWLTGLNACHRGRGYTRGDPPTIIQWMEVNISLHALCPLFVLFVNPSMGMSGFARGV